MRGLTRIARLVLELSTVFQRNMRPTTGKSLRNGTPFSALNFELRYSPPTSMMPPSGTVAVVRTRRMANSGNWIGNERNTSTLTCAPLLTVKVSIWRVTKLTSSVTVGRSSSVT